ncbi:MAG: bifunctional pyr operon transcriptional regulator/uracil phosphoribosyltransferase PyrR [Deltaproteobacteria bacterium]|jgi:pyrimidine operon attenuation protein/uracil phosphoribosyltransferase|nr:bifunctional pyr operon transcriptional regulator/uracil phosphoribosyltransferase PyrR [Deltaproteobacteria bacterium]
MKTKLPLHDKAEIAAAVKAMADGILARRGQPPVLVGIRRGGVPLTERLAAVVEARTGQKTACGIVDINLYRDDWSKASAFPKVGRTDISFSLEGRRVVLVDDVLFTGRTVRAALGVLTDFGRSSRVELAVLVDRGHRETPIQPDYVSFTIPTEAGDIVEVDFSGEEGVFLLKDDGA